MGNLVAGAGERVSFHQGFKLCVEKEK